MRVFPVPGSWSIECCSTWLPTSFPAGASLEHAARPSTDALASRTDAILFMDGNALGFMYPIPARKLLGIDTVNKEAP